MARSRTPLKLFVTLAAVLAVGIVTYHLILLKTSQRKVFTSYVDTASGYRCRFTIPSDWDYEDTLIRPSGWRLDFAIFTQQPSLIRQWIAAHIFHRIVSKWNRPAIILDTTKIEYRYGDNRTQALYPQYYTIPNDHILMQHHLKVDGCLATVTQTSTRDPRYPYTCLIVSTPNRSIEYCVMGGGSRQVNREMQAIIASFYLEKVAGPSGLSPPQPKPVPNKKRGSNP